MLEGLAGGGGIKFKSRKLKINRTKSILTHNNTKIIEAIIQCVCVSLCVCDSWQRGKINAISVAIVSLWCPADCDNCYIKFVYIDRIRWDQREKLLRLKSCEFIARFAIKSLTNWLKFSTIFWDFLLFGPHLNRGFPLPNSTPQWNDYTRPTLGIELSK